MTALLRTALGSDRVAPGKQDDVIFVWAKTAR
jgi:hypothetical protein